MSWVRRRLFGSITTALDPSCGFNRSYNLLANVSRFGKHNLQTATNLGASHKVTYWTLEHAWKRHGGIIYVSRVFRYQQSKKESYVNCSTKSLAKCCFISSAIRCSRTSFPASVSARSYIRPYSSNIEEKQDGFHNAAEVQGATSTKALTDNAANSAGNEWFDSLKQACQSAIDTSVNAGGKVKEMSNEVVYPYLRQLYDSHPYLESIMVPVVGTLSGAFLAWLVMPTILRKCHKYTEQSPLQLLNRGKKEEVPYERSLWSALEDPARYLFTFMAFSQMGVIIAPTASEYLSQAWRGAIVLSFVWFLFRWKTVLFARLLSLEASGGFDRDKLLTLDKVSSVGLLVLGAMALAEACGVPVQSIVTVGGIGGVATAFAARDILGNLLSGLSLQFSRPFSVGDNIKAGAVEGQVVEMGLTATSLINPEKFPVVVPNSLLSSQVIVNKSRAQWRASLAKIPVRSGDLDKIPLVSEEIKSMLRSNPNVLDTDVPYCYLSRVENTFGELTIGYNLKNMKKDELYAAEQDILLQAVKILKKHGAELGNTV